MPTKKHSIDQQERCMIAYYGLHPVEEALRKWYSRSLEWCEKLHCPPHKMGVNGTGFSGKLGSFNRANARLQELGFEGVSGVALFSLLDNAKMSLVGWQLSMEIYLEDWCSVISFGADVQLASFEDGQLFEIGREIVQLFQPDYGIGFRQCLAQGPGLFVLGLSVDSGTVLSGGAYEEAVRNTEWGTTGITEQVYRNGILRDVFPWNFLTDFQLTAKIGRRSLGEWIGADSMRGKLEPFHGSVWLWKVDERQMRRVRKVLWDAGLIFRV